MKMVLVLHFSGALLLLLLLAESTNQAFPVTCCLKTCDIKVRREQIKNYYIQDKPLCPMKAVRFVTQKDVTICSDPSSRWAIKMMAFLDNRDRVKENRTNMNNTSSHI